MIYSGEYPNIFSVIRKQFVSQSEITDAGAIIFFLQNRNIKRCLNLLENQPFHGKKILYFVQIHSHISYGLLVWGPMCSKQILKRLQTMQN